MSADGKHHWKPDIGTQPTCLGDGTVNGEVCTVCGATQAGETGYGLLPALGHKVIKQSQTVGRCREVVTNYGIIEVQCHEVYFICERCGHALGHEYYTIGQNYKVSKYVIEPGKNVKITDISNGIHIDGNMANDGGAYFRNELQHAFGEVLEGAAQKYTYKKVPANSFIVEFTDEFMQEQEDGEYPLEIFNGSEYWPMIVVIKDHKFVEIKTMPEEEAPEWTLDEYNAWVEKVKADGQEVKEYTLGCPER